MTNSYEAHLALLESRFGMAAGKLQPKLYGHFTLDENGKLGHEPTTAFLGRDGLRKNHSCLLFHLIDQKILRKGLEKFFEKVLDYIRLKEFVEGIDVLWHRVKARKAIDALRNTWFSKINLN